MHFYGFPRYQIYKNANFTIWTYTKMTWTIIRQLNTSHDE